MKGLAYRPDKMHRKTFILVSKKKNPAMDEVRELLEHPDVEVLDSLAGRFWQLSLPEGLASEWNDRLTDWTLERDKVYPVPKSHPILSRLPDNKDLPFKK